MSRLKLITPLLLFASCSLAGWWAFAPKGLCFVRSVGDTAWRSWVYVDSAGKAGYADSARGTAFLGGYAASAYPTLAASNVFAGKCQTFTDSIRLLRSGANDTSYWCWDGDTLRHRSTKPVSWEGRYRKFRRWSAFDTANISIAHVGPYIYPYGVLNVVGYQPIVSLFDLTNNNQNAFGIAGGQFQIRVSNNFRALNARHDSGQVMIGSSSSAVNRLDVEGNCAIGAAYSGSSAAPTNGLIVEGATAVCTTAARGTAKLTVKGNIDCDTVLAIVPVAESTKALPDSITATVVQADRGRFTNCYTSGTDSAGTQKGITGTFSGNVSIGGTFSFWGVVMDSSQYVNDTLYWWKAGKRAVMGVFATP